MSEKITSVVDCATLFFNGAEITRNASVGLFKGRNTLIFERLPDSIRAESINVEISGTGTPASVAMGWDHLTEQPVTNDTVQSMQRLEDINKALVDINDKALGLNAQEDFLKANRNMTSDDPGLDGLKELEEYHRVRISEIISNRSELSKDMNKLNAERDAILRSVQNANAPIVRMGKITVEVDAEKDGIADITLSYFTTHARWVPRYEMRADDSNSSANLVMKGDIVQTTKEDWQDVKISLSSGNPVFGNAHPILRPWFIGLEQMMVNSARSMLKSEDMYDECVCEVSCCNEVVDSQPVTMVEERNTAIEFILPIPLDVPSTDREYTVNVVEHRLDAEYTYYCVSKLDRGVFFLASIRGWEGLNLIAGKVSIFNGNRFVCETYLDPSSSNDVMNVSLGRDRSIIVTREKGKDMTTKAIIGKNKKVRKEWMITVRNTKSKNISLKLLDQIPISTNANVTVEPMELSKAELNKDAGELSWMLEIKAGEAVKVSFAYEVNYPKDETIYLE